jgi:hypothetical protein
MKIKGVNMSQGFSSNQYGFNSITQRFDKGYDNLPKFMADVNGDGRADFGRFVGDSPNIFLSFNLATPTGFSANQSGFNSVQQGF